MATWGLVVLMAVQPGVVTTGGPGDEWLPCQPEAFPILVSVPVDSVGTHMCFVPVRPRATVKLAGGVDSSK